MLNPAAGGTSNKIKDLRDPETSSGRQKRTFTETSNFFIEFFYCPARRQVTTPLRHAHISLPPLV